MEMTVKIIRVEDIKPQIPTPPHLKSYSLSFLDQLNRHAQLPMIYFYPKITSTSHFQTSSSNLFMMMIKKSLSETLVHFYPLAGKLSDDGMFIDCNDQGALYVEAHIPDYTLHQFLSSNPADKDLVLGQFIPSHGLAGAARTNTYLLTVQLTVFKCGGVAITHMCSHRVMDGSGALFFMQAWANTARSAAGFLQTNQLQDPTFPGASVFRPDPLLPEDLNLCPWLAFQKKPGKCLTRRFVLDSLALKMLRTKASGSRFEAVVALIWGCAMAASRQSCSSGQRRKGVLLCTFDLRTRMRPLLSDQAFGNLYWKIPMACNGEDSTELQRLVGVVRGGMSRMEEHVSKLGESYVKAYQEFCDGFARDDAESTDYFSCSSVLNRGLYEPDFGWGKPKWVCRGSSELNNWIFMVETAAGDGIEVWVTMEAKAMAVLERNQDLLQFASVDPCPVGPA